MKILLLIMSLSSLACNLSELSKQEAVIDALFSKYQKDKNPIESIRRIDFYGTARVRFVYLAKGLKVKNVNTNFVVDKKCRVSFKGLEF